MRDLNVFNLRKALPRMSWSPKNFYNLWQRTVGPKSDAIALRNTGSKSIFQDRWISKAVVRAYHGDYITERSFERWYLPDFIPDVRPRRALKRGDDTASLEDYAGRKARSDKTEEEIKTKGMPPVGSLMFSEVERRIDTLVFRSCFAESIYEAKRLVTHGDVYLNGKRHWDCYTRLAPGDMISVNPSAVRFIKPEKLPEKEYEDVNGYALLENPDPSKDTPFWLPLYASPHLFIPAYLEVSFATCSAVYVRHPTARPGYSEIPTPYDADGSVVRYAWEWYVRRRPRIRSEAWRNRMPEDRTVKRGIFGGEIRSDDGRSRYSDHLKKIIALHERKRK